MSSMHFSLMLGSPEAYTKAMHPQKSRPPVVAKESTEGDVKKTGSESEQANESKKSK